MTNYQKGARQERAIANAFKERGYTVVRSAGSKGKVDLVCWNSQYVYLIQAKSFKLSDKAKAKLKGELVPWDMTTFQKYHLPS